MRNILEIIYNNSINNRILDLKDIQEILEILIYNKNLQDYISDIIVQPLDNNIVASYSIFSKNIKICIDTVEKMIRNIDNNILNVSDIEKYLYKNLSILQVLLHEVEHANQQKIAYSENSLEAFIIRLSYNVDNAYEGKMYNCCPEERLAEIKSFNELYSLFNVCCCKPNNVQKILSAEKLQRLLNGYHYNNSLISSPLIEYFKLANKDYYLNSFEWYSDEYSSCLKQVTTQYNLNRRLQYGFPIAEKEYAFSMNKLVLSLSHYFKNRVSIK